MPAISPVPERDLTAAAPGPLHGNAIVAALLRNVYGGDGRTPVDAVILRETTDIPTAGRRAGQAAATLRHTARCPRPVSPRWLTGQAGIHQSRSILAADEAEYAAQQSRAAGHRFRSTAFRWWVFIACTNAWVEAHLRDAAAILSTPDADHEAARAWMLTAAERLDCVCAGVGPW
ncbi:hypothetical protein ACH4PU_35990 [Streptomyces sp. NPDC021100]|uniref:hypothetical protein n=1 Tax=Streptomyces sp. NPDC021100 TaxID=3365114 RepID=UPI0037969080